MSTKRIVFATTGSLGEIFPIIVLAAGMKKRGHEAIVATNNVYQSIVEQAGVTFARMRPDLSNDSAFINKIWEKPIYWVKDVQNPAMRDTYDDLVAACAKADLFVSRHLVLPAPLVPETTGIPWVTTRLYPAEFISATDPPYLRQVDGFIRLIQRSPRLTRWLTNTIRHRLRRFIFSEAGRLREKLGLKPSAASDHRGMEPVLDLVLFSDVLGKPQPDWSPLAVQAGFLYSDDARPDPPLPDGLAAFLAAGPPPIVFTTGSIQMSRLNQTFLVAALDMLVQLGRRGILITGGAENRACLPDVLPEGILAVDYAPHGPLFSRAAAVVTHGGVGTTALALRCGLPQLVYPIRFDQPDNAHRLEALGVARAIYGRDYDPAKGVAALRTLLDDPQVRLRARAIADRLHAENGLEAACDALERVLGTPGAASVIQSPACKGISIAP